MGGERHADLSPGHGTTLSSAAPDVEATVAVPVHGAEAGVVGLRLNRGVSP